MVDRVTINSPKLFQPLHFITKEEELISEGDTKTHSTSSDDELAICPITSHEKGESSSMGAQRRAERQPVTPIKSHSKRVPVQTPQANPSSAVRNNPTVVTPSAGAAAPSPRSVAPQAVTSVRSAAPSPRPVAPKPAKCKAQSPLPTPAKRVEVEAPPPAREISRPSEPEGQPQDEAEARQLRIKDAININVSTTGSRPWPHWAHWTFIPYRCLGRGSFARIGVR
ncbi:hypothetical protein J3E71DRAFT_378512 [Bipolaris maydis]|nr:hypothetical protein J3E71DRAFT_378512 [Bipolaris maydis]